MTKLFCNKFVYLQKIMTPKTAIMIPVRMASTRLPGKPLAKINGKTMIHRVFEQAKKAEIGEVFIACDGEEIAAEVQKFGGRALITNPELQSGTDRIFSALKQINSQFDFSFVINLQGDLPNIDPKSIQICAEAIKNDDCDIATLASRIKKIEDIHNQNIVKIALAQNGQALYFSRCAIPYSKNPMSVDSIDEYFHHIGVYAYKTKALEKFISLPPSNLELRESLEQLRALENGLKIKVAIVENQPISVDCSADLKLAQEFFAKKEN